FAPTSEIVARSADPFSITQVGDPLVPCLIGDPAATVEISEQYTTAFVDQGDPSESTFPGQPASARPLFGATNSTRINIVLAGLVPGITIQWPTTVHAVSGNAVLDLVSQANDGSSALYVFGTPNQAASDVLQETFDISLTAANFTFSGNNPIAGD